MKDVEARIAGEDLERLMIAAAEFTQDDHFGMRQGQLTDIADLGILGYTMMHSGKIGDALEAYHRYNVILCSGFNLDWEFQGDNVLLRMYLQNPTGRMSRHCTEDMASSLYHLICKMSNRHIPLRELQFMHAAPDDISPYVSVFGREAQFGGTANLLRMSKDVMNYPIIYSNSRLRNVFEKIAIETKNKLLVGSKLSNEVFQWMMDCIPVYFPTLQQTAVSFKMSVRTLQTRLKEEDTSFNDLAVSVRKEMAMGYLRIQEYSVGDITYLLHYSEPSAFQSAFKKWTGLTPRQYRESITQHR